VPAAERRRVAAASPPRDAVRPTLAGVPPWSLRLIERTPERLRPWVRLAVRTGHRVAADRLPGLSAEIAFWVLLSLPALLLTALAAASAAGDLTDTDWQQQFVSRTLEVSRVALTDRTVENLLRPNLTRLVEDGGIAVASFAFVGALWTASRAVRIVLTTIAIAYDRQGVRKAWQDRLLGFGVTLAGMAVGAVLMPLLLAGPNFGEQLVGWLGQDPINLAELWRRLYWPAIVLAATFTIAALYHLGIPGHSPWRRDLPGAVLATSVWLLGSVGLRLYGTWVLGGDSIYGPLAGPIVALLWLWLTGFAVLLGAALNAAIEAEWPTTGGPATRTVDAPVTGEATATRRMVEPPHR
jgi:membrane protein